MAILKLLPRFRRLESSLRELEQRESWSASEIAEFQLDRINAIWSTASQSVPYYARLAREMDLPPRFDSLDQYRQQIPVLNKEKVRSHPDDFLSSESRPGQWQRTGGSTGVPMSIFWERDAHFEMLRAKYRSEQAYGLDVFDKKVFLWGHSGSFAPGISGAVQRVKRPIEDHLRNRLRVSAYDLSPNQLLDNLLRIQSFKPKSMYGYSSAIDLIAAAAQRHNIELPSLRVAMLTAEPADELMLTRVGERLGCQALIEYGAVECGLIAYRMPDKRLRTRDDMVYVETIPNGTNSHDIVLTVLNNPSFPLMRYRIEDTTSDSHRRDSHGFGILTDVQGRSNDSLVSKSGRRLHPMKVKHVLEHWQDVRRFTARQYEDGAMKVTLEAPEKRPRDLDKLQSKLESILEGYQVSIETVDQIPGNLAGKHRWIISDMCDRQT